MPYIVEDKRRQLDPFIDQIHQVLVDLETDDELNNMEGNINYLVTRLLMMVYGDKDGTRYAGINDAVGVLECIKMEFYRKVASPYEDQKEFDNGQIPRFTHPAEVVGQVTITPEMAEAYNQIVEQHGTFADPKVNDEIPD